MSILWSIGTVFPGVPGSRVALGIGDQMLPNSPIFSPDGYFAMNLQSDGNFVHAQNVNGTWNILYSSNTTGCGCNRLVLGKDGNLVLYTVSGLIWTAYWQTATAGNYQAHLDIQNDGNLILFS